MADATEKTTSSTQPHAPEKPAATEYFFPTHGVTITATSLEEAEKKLADQLKSNKQ